jgi:hypothetical protein
VTDAGLRHLRTLTKLRSLILNYCGTSKAAEDELQQQIPGLYIEHERDEEESDGDSEAELSD